MRTTANDKYMSAYILRFWWLTYTTALRTFGSTLNHTRNTPTWTVFANCIPVGFKIFKRKDIWKWENLTRWQSLSTKTWSDSGSNRCSSDFGWNKRSSPGNAEKLNEYPAEVFCVSTSTFRTSEAATSFKSEMGFFEEIRPETWNLTGFKVTRKLESMLAGSTIWAGVISNSSQPLVENSTKLWLLRQTKLSPRCTVTSSTGVPSLSERTKVAGRMEWTWKQGNSSF